MPNETAKTDIETAKAIGALGAQMTSVQERLTSMEKKLDSVVAMTNRWKGATTILVALGGLIGWGMNLLLKAAGKA